MLKKHLAVMFMFIMAAGVFSQSIPSGTGRYAALSGSPFILDAHVDMLNNPAWNNYYRDYAFADLSPFNGNDFYGHAGVTFGVGKKWNLGMVINKRSDAFSNFNLDTLKPAVSPILPFMGLIGYTASKDLHLGLAPYVAMNKNKIVDTVGSSTSENSAASLGANLGFIYMIKKGWIEGAVKFRMNSFKNEVVTGGTTSTVENDGGMEIGVGFRAWIYPSKGSKIAVVPLIGFYTTSFQPTATSGGTTVNGLNYSWMNINGGVGLNWPIMDDIQIAGGVTATYSSFKSDTGSFEFKRNVLTAPAFHMAVETRIADWITGRMGFYKALEMNSEEGTPHPGFPGRYVTEFNFYNPSSDAQTFSMGAGFHFGRFSVDATVQERWLKQGPYWISGSNSGNSTDLFGEISASYNFGK
jgi:hypothetical protein